MKALSALVGELFGLFVDDGWLALAILAVVALAAICAALSPNLPLLPGVVLLLGCLGVLLANVLRAARR